MSPILEGTDPPVLRLPDSPSPRFSVSPIRRLPDSRFLVSLVLRLSGSLNSLMRALFIGVITAIGLGVLSGPPPVRAQPDSVRTEILKERGFDPDHSPRGALWRAAVAPGWGQIYNRDYVKVPFVWGGLAGMGALVYWTNDQYLLYRRAALFRLGEERMMGNDDITENEWAQYEDEFDEVAAIFGEDVASGRLRDRRDSFRSRRDLSIVGTGLFYALTLLDAYVSAHLLTFDVSDDLAVRAVPTGRLPNPSGFAARRSPQNARSSRGPALFFETAATTGPGVTVRLRF